MRVARNILCFTLILDYEDGSKDNSIWNIYYHLYLDKNSLKLLHTQAEKLYFSSASMTSWHSSEHGHVLRMCDQETLAKVRGIWESYGSLGMSEVEKANRDKRFESGIKRAKDRQSDCMGAGLNFTGYRSAAPVSVKSLKDLPELFEHFWTHGVTDKDHNTLCKSKIPNPMFAGSLEDTFILHYGTDPLVGFHLATAYAPLIAKSSFERPQKTRLHKVVAAARQEFQEWLFSFRKQVKNKSMIRFFHGDALAFCHTLQHMHTAGDGSEANWYRDQYHMTPLVLDGEDYGSQGDAPLSFNVVDTSNLLDHVGSINLLVTATPLLEHSLSTTLYTEALVKQEEDLGRLVENILCGHFPTLSILFGLMPIEYWTNSTAISSVDEQFLDKIIHSEKERASNTGQMYTRIIWKRLVGKSPVVPIMSFNAPQLAHILYQVYLRMFKNEDFTQMISNINPRTILNMSVLHFHRGSLASFLCFIKKRVITDWDKVMDIFDSLVENNPTLMMGMNYIQELYVHLHLLGLYSPASFKTPFNRTGSPRCLKGITRWKDIPAVVCITLKVPRARLGVITNVSLDKLGTPILQCILQSSGKYPGRQWQNIFVGLQLAFGDIKACGPRDEDTFNLKISHDKHGWSGHSALIVSFMAPSWVILLEPHDATVALGIQSTPQSSYTFVNRLGLEVSIYKTNLGNETEVFITKYRPNQPGHASVCNFEKCCPALTQSASQDVCSTIKADVDFQTGEIKILIGRLDILSNNLQSSLRSGAIVETFQTAYNTIGIAIGKNGPTFNLHFPAPILRSRSKSRIARKSSYIEIVAPMADHIDGMGFQHLIQEERIGMADDQYIAHVFVSRTPSQRDVYEVWCRPP